MIYTDFHLETERLVSQWNDAFDNNHMPSEVWFQLNQEEVAETIKEICDLIWVGRGYVQALENEEDYEKSDDVCEQVDAFTDAMIALFGEEVIVESFQEIFRSNMSKLGEDGFPVRREDGKILKGPKYSPADITSIVEKYYGS